MKFLLVKLNHLGDTLLMTPTLRYLRCRFPDARIDVVVRQGGEAVLEGNADISHIMTVPAPVRERRGEERRKFLKLVATVWKTGYDYAFDLSNSDRAKILVAASRARVRGINDCYGQLGWKRRLFNRFSSFAWAREHQVLRDFRTVADIVDGEHPAGGNAEAPPLHINTDIDFDRLSAVLPGLQPDTAFAVIHPVSRWQFKQWLPDQWAEVADRLAEQGLRVVFSCGPVPEEQAHIQSILAACRHAHLATDGRLSLRELAALIGRSRIFLGVDTVAMHIAAATGTPCVVLFGPSSEWSWHPWQCRHELVLGDCGCKITRKFVCDKSTIYPCMAGISTDAVLGAAGKLLNG